MNVNREDLIKEAKELLAQLTPEEAKEVVERVRRDQKQTD